MSEAEQAPPGVDPATPSTARLYDFYLGGSANFAADRATAQRMLELVPEISEGAWANRGFHQRAALWMAERGVRQFIDIGAGLPTQGNTHEVVLKFALDARVVYVDNDPMVAAHASPRSSRTACSRASDRLGARRGSSSGSARGCSR